MTESPSPALYSELRGLAEAAARAGGAVSRAAFGRRHDVRRKSDGSEVTAADEAAQAAVIARIRAARPSDLFIGEEDIPELSAGTSSPPVEKPRVTWVIDPIDGTRNFIRGMPMFACSVAACAFGRPVAGAILAPQTDELYSADERGPLFLNSVPIDPAARRGADPKPLLAIPSTSTGRAHELVSRCQTTCVLRSLGTTALHLAYVASGACDAMISSDGKLWDIAAGAVLVRAAGGICATFTGGSHFPIDFETYRGTDMPSVAVRDTSLLQKLLAGA